MVLVHFTWTLQPLFRDRRKYSSTVLHSMRDFSTRQFKSHCIQTNFLVQLWPTVAVWVYRPPVSCSVRLRCSHEGDLQWPPQVFRPLWQFDHSFESSGSSLYKVRTSGFGDFIPFFPLQILTSSPRLDWEASLSCYPQVSPHMSHVA